MFARTSKAHYKTSLNAEFRHPRNTKQHHRAIRHEFEHVGPPYSRILWVHGGLLTAYLLNLFFPSSREKMSQWD